MHPAEDEPAAYPRPDLAAPQLTVRALATGMALGGVLSLCNVYSGLKIGWSFNMSVTAALLGWAAWRGAERFGARPFGILENNVNQTGASSGASVSSAGLVAPIPALAMLTGQTLPYPWLVLWILSVGLVGITVAVGLRHQLLVVDRLRFPGGVATAETVREMYAKGAEALARVRVLLAGGAAAAAAKLTIHGAQLRAWGLPGALPVPAGSPLAAAGLSRVGLGQLTFALDPSPLFVAVGALVGVRAGLSMLLGAVVAWGWLAPTILHAGWVSPPDDPTGSLLPAVRDWLLWPGVAMMVTGSLTSFAFSWPSIARALRGGGGLAGGGAETRPGDVPRRWFLGGLAVALVLATTLQIALFDIAWWTAVLAVLLTFLLAVVAGRVSGETNITPVGPMGKVTQLMFGVLSPGNATANLMSANITGGAASQCGDLLHDLKAGLLIGAAPRTQAVAQVLGISAGAVIGSAVYLVLVPDPSSMLLTEEWPAPAVAAWKSVAEIMSEGLDTLPRGALDALWGGALGGVVLAVLEKVLPARLRPWVPSPTSGGLAFVIPASLSVGMALGAVLALVLGRVAPGWSRRFLVVVASGVIAGESLMGVALALWQTFRGLAG